MFAAVRVARPAGSVARNTIKNLSSARALSTSAIRRSDDGHHAAAPAIFGTGAKPGEVPTDENQSTGLERIQIFGNLRGIHVFDKEPLDASRLGTLKDPIKVVSPVPERIIGCTGFPAESHDTLWFKLTNNEIRRCPECGSGAPFSPWFLSQTL
ncbi:cytochrome c oxidase subunit VB-domain-containing protein [Vararia minispora EC-137]|uniref:Cytochrome c oxidase subunit VB-domain-containing protein n=1 Tax=Vararia minispora EC-137 TaxID=1314806 RepID=A0ACB8QNV1_9AGAM|nr:cytochrome c oxidase subunit VB-domain-containing protein [Vararia minispora EC-137]